MKTFPMVSACLLAALVSSAAPHVYAKNSDKPSRTEVIFSNPENFTDVKDREVTNEKDRDEILSRIRTFIVDQADAKLPAGQKLTITFTNIDMAGEYEPWLGPRWSDVRIVKAIYPPRLKFSYKITDAAGQTVKQGAEDIIESGFDQRLTFDRQDSLRYEKDILDNWIRSKVVASK